MNMGLTYKRKNEGQKNKTAKITYNLGSKTDMKSMK